MTTSRDTTVPVVIWLWDQSVAIAATPVTRVAPMTIDRSVYSATVNTASSTGSRTTGPQPSAS